jgi:hypothetical protein
MLSMYSHAGLCNKFPPSDVSETRSWSRLRVNKHGPPPGPSIVRPYPTERLSSQNLTVHIPKSPTRTTRNDIENQMDPNYKFPGSPLLQISPERVNQQRNESGASPSIGGGHSRDSSVYEKVAKFDSLATQSKALERKANDAALKRAMVGREEAETEMRRYREEVRTLRKQVEEGYARERKVAERLETVMVGF